MSEATGWNVLPQAWLSDMPEYWVDRIQQYFQAKAEVEPSIMERRRRAAEAQAPTARKE